MNTPCGCCSGPNVVTPRGTDNRPGLSALTYRVGTWATFLATMQARLSGHDQPELAGLKTRDPADLSMALLDGWAVLGDVLTFYQERIANEGYLRTATERRSILELARLIGYQLRPGVSASVFLAFTIDPAAAPVVIPVGVGANSVPGPGEQMQTFETADVLEARSGWNVLKPRPTQPQTSATIATQGLYLQGTATKLKANDALVVVAGPTTAFVHLTSVHVDAARGWTVVGLPPGLNMAPGAAPDGVVIGEGASTATVDPGNKGTNEDPPLTSVVQALTRPPSIPPASPARLARRVEDSFAPGGDTFPRLLATVEPRLSGSLYTAIGNLVPPDVPLKAVALRVSAAPFGHNAPLRLVAVANGIPDFDEWQISDPLNRSGDVEDPGPHIAALKLDQAAAAAEPPDGQRARTVFLDNEYDIAPDSWVVIEKATGAPIIVAAPTQIIHRSLAAYGLTGKTVQIDLPDSLPWIKGDLATPAEPYSTVRTTRVFAGSESLALAEVPITADVGGGVVELDDVYQDLEAGRWLVVAGERTDVRDSGGKIIPGIETAELVMLSSVQQTPSGLPGEQSRTTITFARDLRYTYKRDTVTVYGNVVRATHGQTRSEVLGGGDAAQSMPRFTLKPSPLTFVSAPTSSGVATTLAVRVNDLPWHEAPGLAHMAANDRKFVTRTDDEAKTTVVFGTGQRGARLPTGHNNVRSSYRTGIGAPGNVQGGQISLLAD
ncbi:MAG: hypothetical protein QOF30_2903, partial [Acidimicrobiaceae bacterium]|nr:hypothetical protein [Acidimicrobiaceae bacterium]